MSMLPPDFPCPLERAVVRERLRQAESRLVMVAQVWQRAGAVLADVLAHVRRVIENLPTTDGTGAGDPGLQGWEARTEWVAAHLGVIARTLAEAEDAEARLGPPGREDRVVCSGLSDAMLRDPAQVVTRYAPTLWPAAATAAVETLLRTRQALRVLNRLAPADAPTPSAPLSRQDEVTLFEMEVVLGRLAHAIARLPEPGMARTSAEAAGAVGQLTLAVSSDELQAYLQHPERGVRLAALRHLGVRRAPERRAQGPAVPTRPGLDA